MKLSTLLHKISHPHKLSTPAPDFNKLQKLDHYDPPLEDRIKSSCTRPSSTTRVPRGYLPVCVGDEAKRYLIKTKHLNNPLFVQLLELSAKEYGYSHTGVLRIVCDAQVFERVLASTTSSRGARALSSKR